MDRFEAMATLLAVVKEGSLSAAGAGAAACRCTTLSRRSPSSRRVLGTRLLIRTTRKLTLTDAGIAYVEAARRILVAGGGRRARSGRRVPRAAGASS